MAEAPEQRQMGIQLLALHWLEDLVAVVLVLVQYLVLVSSLVALAVDLVIQVEVLFLAAPPVLKMGRLVAELAPAEQVEDQ